MYRATPETSVMETGQSKKSLRVDCQSNRNSTENTGSLTSSYVPLKSNDTAGTSSMKTTPATTAPTPLKSVTQRQIQREVQLPILVAKNEFCQRLERSRILIVTAETGSGKSTQLPQYAAEHFQGLVVCTQPRVIAAMSLAHRVAEEYDGTSVGKSVGYRVGCASVGKENNCVPGKDIIFATDAVLVHENYESGLLDDATVLIIDEAHERSVYTDIMIGIAKILLSTRKDFYVVIASATIDPSKFIEFFELTDDSILRVPGRLHHVTLQYIPTSEVIDIDHVISTLHRVYDDHDGNILVFLPGAGEINRAMKLFNCAIPNNCVALPLYSALSLEEQNRVLLFHRETTNKRMVVFCTNIAETSVTIENVRLVIDSGLTKEARFDVEARFTVLELMRICRSSAEQRKGRAGRTAPGHCIRLYVEEALHRENLEPPISCTSLDLVVLQIAALKIDPPKFPFINPPDLNAIQTSLSLLKSLGCIDDENRLTPRGELFNELTIDPRLSAFLVDSYLEHGPILELAAMITAMLSVPHIRADLTGAQEEDKTAAKNRIIDGATNYNSDLLYLVSIFREWRTAGSIDMDKHSCKICNTPCLNMSSCPACREVYCLSRLLNNRSLYSIENLYELIISVIKKPRWQLMPVSSVDKNENDIIGYNLLKHFPERYGIFRRERSIPRNAILVKSKCGVRLSDNSVLSYQQITNPHFIAMSVIPLTNGKKLVDTIHPLRPSLEMKKILESN